MTDPAPLSSPPPQAVIYLEARKRVQEQVLFRLFLIMWLVGVPTSLGVIAVFAFNQEFFAVRREVRNGMYSPFAYLLASTAIQLPMMLILAAGAISISAYGIGAFWGPNYLLYLITYAVVLWGFECLAQLCSVASANPLMGMLNYMNLWFAGFLFAGVMVPEEDVIWPFRAFCYILPFRWGLTSMAFIEYKDATYGGAVLDPSVEKGYTCPGDTTGLACYGVTGTQVLDAIGANYKSISSEDTLGRDIGYNLVIAAVCKLGYIAFMSLQMRSKQKWKKKSD